MFLRVSNKSRTRSEPEIPVVSRGFKLICLLSLAALHWAMILAVCPALHELIHREAANQHHDCAVTAVLSGGIEHTPLVPILLPGGVPFREFIEVSFEAERSASVFLSCSILEHAPPLRN
jgi:hypothetical protein